MSPFHQEGDAKLCDDKDPERCSHRKISDAPHIIHTDCIKDRSGGFTDNGKGRDEPMTNFGRWTVLKRLGAGGQGVVYHVKSASDHTEGALRDPAELARR
jgi:hypothetical protein